MRARPLVVGGLLIAAAAAALFWPRGRHSRPEAILPAPSTNLPRTISGKPPPPEVAARFLAIEAREKAADLAYWAAELLAQECGQKIESFWDALNRSTNKWETAREFDPGEVLVSAYELGGPLPHRIIQHNPVNPARALGPADWRAWLESFRSAGWEPSTFEFRHNRFETNAAGGPLRSVFRFSAQLANSARPERAALEGDLVVEWGEKNPEDGLHAVRRMDARAVRAKTRAGKTPFRLILDETVEPEHGSLSIDPLIVCDLDRDGFSEIVLGARNRVYRRTGPDRYLAEPLCRQPPGPVSTALIADFDGDSAADFLAQTFDGLQLFRGNPQGRFEEPARPACAATIGLEYPMAMTCGDADGDGDLDVFIGQYRDPYEDGAVPTPFFNANDGRPCFLLLNDGRGKFADSTERSGLASYRFRRSYSASFLPLGWPPATRSGSGLDLVVISDFAGIDLYENDGRGKFADRTVARIKHPRAFGMAHCVSDFDNDGVLDLLMTGMNSPTVERLEHLGLERPGLPGEREMRREMTHGNRLYLGGRAGAESGRMGASIARSGWSWGCTAPDVDNDGFADLFIVNGLESNSSVRDYESEYWLHDRFAAGRTNDPAALLYFQAKFTRTRGGAMSYGGHEKNRLYLNLRGREFVEAGHLFGVAAEEDSRNAVSEDLDGDGRMDLIYTTMEIWPAKRQRLRILKNELENAGNWIAFRNAPVGTRILVGHGPARSVRAVIAGDSYGSQHSGAVHFGLGERQEAQAEFRRPDGSLAAAPRTWEANQAHPAPTSEK